MKRDERKKLKRKQAKARTTIRAKRSDTEQLQMLNSRLGHRLGARKERSRIKENLRIKRIAKAKKVKNGNSSKS